MAGLKAEQLELSMAGQSVVPKGMKWVESMDRMLAAWWVAWMVARRAAKWAVATVAK